MAEFIIAHSAQETHGNRPERGHQLFEERGVEFRHERGAWLVPSENGGGFYEGRPLPRQG